MRQQRIQPVRVLFIDHVVQMSGAEQSLADLVIGLAQGPVEPVVALPGDGPLANQLRANGILVRRVRISKRLLETSRTSLRRRPLLALARLAAFLAASWRIYRIVRQVRPRIVHANTLKADLLAILPCKLARVPLVWHVRDILPPGWLRRVFVGCARFSSAVIVPSRAVAEPFRHNRRAARKLRLVPNGIRVEDFQDARTDRSLRETMGVVPSDPVVGIVGRIAPWKGQEVFVRAAAMLAARHPRAHFAIVGAVLFPENDAAFEQHLHRLVWQYGLQDRVSFLGWQPAPEAMASIDIFVHASMEPEPFGRSIVEAMAAGKPVVASGAGAVPEIVPPSAGFLVPPARPELLADALDRLLADRKLRKRMGEAGASVAESFFPVARTVQSIAGVYRTLAAQSMRKAAARKRWMPKRASKPKRRPQQQQPQPSWQQGRPAAPASHEHPPVPAFGAPGSSSDRRFAPGEEPGFFGVPQPTRTSRRRKSRPRAPEPVELQPASALGSPAPAQRSSPRSAPLIEDEPVEPRRARRAAVPHTRPGRRRIRASIEPAAVTTMTEQATVASASASSSALALPAFVPPAPPVPVAPLISIPAPVYRPKPVYDAIKRALDITIALGVLVLGAPLWLFVAMMIKLESRGPVLHKGIVHGKGGRGFTYYKFRSMRVDGDDKAHRRFIERYVRENGGHDEDGQTFYKLLGDDRVTDVGRFIRKLSIDEVPQLLNVLRGDMSLVGPRPPLDYEYELYNDYAKQRLAVRPGLTGMQQVWHRHTASFEEKLKLDLKYIEKRSTWLDLKLILHTIPAALRGH